ncbi:MAG: hypothetical protein H6629_23685 [Calditrichae bacterium]|nr:hypothetical protein [Calditrichia bacterium]
MEYFRKVFIFVFILFATVSCTSPTENRTSNVEVTIEAGQLIKKTIQIKQFTYLLLSAIFWLSLIGHPILIIPQ